MTTVNTVNFPAPLKSPSVSSGNKEKTSDFQGKTQVPNALETPIKTPSSTEADGPKIITQIEASVLVTQTVNTDGTISQFPKQGVVDYYIKSQQDLASNGDHGFLPNSTKTDKA